MSTPRTRSAVKKEESEKFTSAKRGKRVKKTFETKKDVKAIKKEEELQKKEIKLLEQEGESSEVSDTPVRSTRSHSKG